MINVICAPKQLLPIDLPENLIAFSFFEKSDNERHSHISLNWHKALKKAGYRPPIPVWDFVLICLAVAAADFKCKRRSSEDGWTRKINLTVALNDPNRWNNEIQNLQNMFRILTGDFWSLNFTDNGFKPPQGSRKTCDRDCIALLSGGLDSLIGGIDLIRQGKKPIFVSQIAKGDRKRQIDFAEALDGSDWHQLWPKIFAGTPEDSTRGRSIVFFAHAILATTLLDLDDDNEKIIFVPENGFISINPPLSPGRVASFSTKTTYPVFMKAIEDSLNRNGINVRLILPFKFQTKGEMMLNCLDQSLLKIHASNSTSCGRFGRKNFKHCGRCVPCMVRKAAFIKWNEPDNTEYLCEGSELNIPAKSSPDDAMAVACAILQYKDKGIERFLKATTYFASGDERVEYEGVVERGLKELEVLLVRDSVLEENISHD